MEEGNGVRVTGGGGIEREGSVKINFTGEAEDEVGVNEVAVDRDGEFKQGEE